MKNKSGKRVCKNKKCQKVEEWFVTNNVIICKNCCRHKL